MKQMRKTITHLIAPLAFLPLAAAAQAGGIASSPEGFAILRGGEDRYTASNAVVAPGDVIEGTTSAVHVEFAGGNAVLVDQGGEVALRAANEMELRKGALIAGKRGADPVRIAYADLGIEPVGGTEGSATVFVGEAPTGELQVAVFDGVFSIVDDRTREGISSLGSGDSILLRRVGDAWQPVLTGLSASAQSGLNIIETGALNIDVERGFFWWWTSTTPIIILGGLGAGVGTFVILDQLDDGSRSRDDDDDPPRRFFSPITSNDDED